MRLHRFYITESIDLRTEISVNSPELVNQIRKVFRLKNGDEVILFDGSGSDYVCRIEGGDKESVVFAVSGSARSRHMPDREVALYAAVVKKDTFEWIVEKATELGVTRIIPVMAGRSEKKNLNEARLKRIAIEASEQSGRGTIPVIEPIVAFKDAVTAVAASSIPSIAFHTEGESIHVADLKGKNAPQAIFIGPEGGWSEEEEALFHENKIPVHSLGTQVLRAETAVVAALSLTMLGK